MFTNHEEQILLKLKSSREQRSFLAFFASARIQAQFEYITEGSQILDFTHPGARADTLYNETSEFMLKLILKTLYELNR